MARPLRIDIPGGVYPVTSRGLERREAVADDADREKWSELLDRVATRCRWRVFAWALMGPEGFVARMRRWLEGRLPDREVPAARQLRGRLDLREVDAAVAEAFGVPAESLHVRGHWHNDARGAAMYLARRLTGASVFSLGARYGGVCGQAASVIVRHVAERLPTNPRLARAVRACENRLRKN